ncbi:hypothetical protein FS749_008997 [Ceratobasidium sp. UAMH 11750]|nr:hypothetical protein FS749_008997 [Ceratobasidium sp. UAMH 11750]
MSRRSSLQRSFRATIRHSVSFLTLALSGLSDAAVAYILKLRDVFPISSRTGVPDAGDRLVERIAELERRLALARADEAQAKLELLTYRARYPPGLVAGEEHVAGSRGGKRPGSPSSGNKKAPKKKKKQPDTSADDRVWFEERCAQLDAALEVIQKSSNPGTHLKSVGLVASLLRLRGAPTLSVQPTVVPLLQRCLTDASAHSFSSQFRHGPPSPM